MPEPIITVIMMYSVYRFCLFFLSWFFAVSIATFLIYVLVFRMDDYQDEVFRVDAHSD